MKPLVGLVGILIGAIASVFNDQATVIALPDFRGAFDISYDPGTWVQSLYGSAQIIGMAVSPWLLVTFTLRRWTLFAIALCCVSTVLIPLSPNIEAIYALRLLQGFAGGLIIPLLMTTALRALPPNIRIYGLAAYALSASFTSAMAASLAGFWTDLVNWRFVFFQAVPLCTIAAALVWYGDPQDVARYERFRCTDWRGVLLAIAGFGAFSTMLYHGNRLDWFNSQLICVLALISVVAIPLFVLNEWFHPLPLMKLQMLGRPNLAYGLIALVIFLIVAQGGTTVPMQVLEQVDGYRPLQWSMVTLEIALAQIVLLPVMAFVLDFPQVDARVVSYIGLALILTACIGSSYVNIVWNRDQFFFWRALQAVGQPMVIMPLLLMATNSVKGPAEAPYAASLFNTPRAIAEVVAVWLWALIAQWRGALHYDRIVDQIGQNRFSLVQSNGVLPDMPTALLPDGRPRVLGSLQALGEAVQQQVALMSAADTFLVLGALTVFLMIVLVVLPIRTLPPRIQLARQ